MISIEQIIQSLAWSLFHSLWQIGIIGIVIFTILQLDWIRDPKQRFGLLLTGISLSAIEISFLPNSASDISLTLKSSIARFYIRKN